MLDLVCGMELIKETEFKAVHEDKPYFFCSEPCLKDFKNQANKFLKTEPAIRLENVVKSYLLGKIEVPVLRGLSMRVWRGDLLALVGPSGSGKSTAMNLIGTLDMPTSGKIWIDGRDTSEMTEDILAHLRSQKIGFVFQQFNLIPSLSALENVMLPKILRGQSGQAVRQKAEELLQAVGLSDRAKHKPMELSGGEQQRVAIARAFMNDPEIILADEPTGNLDSTTSAKIIDLLVELWQTKKKTIVIVTHDPHVASHAQRILSFKDGQLVRNHAIAEQAIWKEKAH